MRTKEENPKSKGWRRIVGLLSVALASLLLARAGFAQSWQLMPQPKLGIPTSIAVAANDTNRAFVAAEHDGDWDSTDGLNFRWTYVYPYAPPCT